MDNVNESEDGDTSTSSTVEVFKHVRSDVIHGAPFKFPDFLKQLTSAYSEAIETCNTEMEREFTQLS